MTRNIQATDAQGNKVSEPVQINGVDPTPSGGGGAFEDGDGDGVYTLPNAGDGINVASADIDNLSQTNIGAKAYLSANQTISATTNTKVAFDSVDYDDEGEFDTTNNKFVASEAGAYRVNVKLLYDGTISSGVSIRARIYKNGSLVGDARNHSASSTFVSAPITGTFKLAANDTIEIYTYHDDSAAVDIHSANDSIHTSVEIEQVG